MRLRRSLAIAGAALLLQACCAPRPERIVLLPQQPAGSALLVQRGSEVHRLDQPYAQVRVPVEGPMRADATTPEAVRRDFGHLLDMGPPPARSFIVSFQPNANTLTPATRPVLEEVRQALAAQPVGELIVIGHTDNVGSDEDNDRLALERAQTVAEILQGMGVRREQISVQARGMREPLVAVPPQTAEPRNRRVEIKLR